MHNVDPMVIVLCESLRQITLEVGGAVLVGIDLGDVYEM